MSFINKMNIGNVSYDIQSGEKMQLTFPAGATNGTLTDEQLATLNTNYQSCIEMVNDKELYYLNDNGHVDGYLTYSHVGIEESKATIKTLTITVSTKAFVIVTTVVPTESGGGGGGGGVKLYVHRITITSNNDNYNKVIKGNFLSTRGTNYDVTDDFEAYFLPGSTITINDVTYGIKRYGNMPGHGYRDYDHFNITTYEQSGGPFYSAPTFSEYYVTEL